MLVIELIEELKQRNVKQFKPPLLVKWNDRIYECVKVTLKLPDEDMCGWRQISV